VVLVPPLRYQIYTNSLAPTVGIGMSGVTPKHEVLPGDRDRRGRGG
jgi:hypothetical protein